MSDYVRFRVSLVKSARNKKDTLEIDIIPSQKKREGKVKGVDFSNIDFSSYLNEFEVISYNSNIPLVEKREKLKAFGGRLFELVFRGVVGEKYEEVMLSGKSLVLEIYGQDQKLQMLPWEFVYDAKHQQFLAPLDTFPVVRLIELPRLIKLHPLEKLRILVVISSPKNLPLLNVLQEKKNIQTAIQDSKDKLEIDYLENANFSNLSEKLSNGQYNILHFIGHGGINPELNTGYLCLENESGLAEIISGESLGLLIRNTKSMHLVVLNACESARVGWNAPSISLASTLISMDVPSVIAMQYPISDQAAVAFSRAFYSAIAQGYDIAKSVAQARRRIHHDTIDKGSPLVYEWGVPVLFLGNGSLSQFIFTKPNKLLTTSPIEESRKWENEYLNSTINLVSLKGLSAEYIPLRTIPHWVWESESKDITLQAMRGGMPDQDDLYFIQHHVDLQLLDELAKHDRVVILGKPGAGKTTTLKYLLQYYSSLGLQDNLRSKLPVLINLNEYKSGQPIIDFIESQLSELVENSLARSKPLNEYIKASLIEGRFIIMFDGLNEMVDYRASIKMLGSFMRTYSGNKYIFTSRENDYRGELNIEAQLHIDQLDDKQISDFVNKQKVFEGGGESFIQILKRKKLLEVARSPFMLSILIKRVSNKALNDNVKNRTELISWAIREMWTREHNRPGRQDDWIDDYFEIEVLRNIAWYMNSRHITKIERFDAEVIAHETYEKTGLKAEYINVENCIRQAINAGVLRVSQGQYLSFQHQLFQDYYVALNLKRQIELNLPIIDKIIDPTWNDAIVMLVGLSGELARNIIQSILLQPDDIFLNNLWLAARCYSEIKDPDLLSRVDSLGVIDRLLKIFSMSPYTFLRQRAELALIDIGSPAVVNRLEKLIIGEDFDAYLPIRCMRVIEKIGASRSVSIFSSILEDTKYSMAIRSRAAEALGNSDSIEVERLLLKILKDSSQPQKIRLGAIAGVSKLNTELGYKELLTLISNESETSLVRERAIAALGRHIKKDEVQSYLVDIVSSPNQLRQLRSRASDVLSRTKSGRAKQLFTQLLADPNESEQLRAKSALCIGMLGNSTDLLLLYEYIQDRQYGNRLRWCAAYAMGYILEKNENKQAINLLGKILEDETEHHFVRWTSAYALGFSQDYEAIQILYRNASLKSTMPDVKRRIIESISRFTTDDVTDLLINLYEKTDQEIETKDAIILGLCKTGGEQSRAMFVNLLSGYALNDIIRRRIISALGIYGNDTELSLIQNIISDEKETIDIRDTAFTTLEKISHSFKIRIFPQKKEETMTIEMIGIPVLTKAVDFLFDEAKKILEERRDARKKDDKIATPPAIPLLDQDKNNLLGSEISEKDLNLYRSKIDEILNEVESYQRNIQAIRNTIASQGGILSADIRWRNQLTENQNALLEASQRLAQIILIITKK